MEIRADAGFDGLKVGRARLGAELDDAGAHLYDLTDSEFAHILGPFPVVAAPVKAATLAALAAFTTPPPRGGIS